VDVPVPLYEFSDPELWRDWTWKQRFPGSAELRSYFQHVAKVWDLRKDTIFGTFVNSAVWNENESMWTIRTLNGLVFKAGFFLLNTGFAAKRHTPDWKGIESFKGTWIHPSYWPKEEPDLRGKKIAVIGTGSTGVQLTQSLAPIASEFTLFQRTPNLAMPMKQAEYAGKDEVWSPSAQAALYAGRKDSFGGMDFNFMPTATFEHNDQERKMTYEKLWSKGDFHFWLATYCDMLFSDKANTEAYNFW
jgi:cation diffusion facilitator CzcD-associated flavoprotein CzcO